jgi:hypothetical protein
MDHFPHPQRSISNGLEANPGDLRLLDILDVYAGIALAISVFGGTINRGCLIAQLE